MFLNCHKVTGVSMSPTYQHSGRLLVLRHWLVSRLNRGQVVVVDLLIHEPNSYAKSTKFIKRILGLEGDVIALESQEQCIVPSNHLFLITDVKGADSRVWGPISYKSWVGIMIWKLPIKRPIDIEALINSKPS